MKAKWGALVVDGRGKIGGHVASKNRFGSYFRTKVSPVNPQSAAQTLVRALFTTLAQGWRDLTQAQRNAWNAAVEKFKGTNVFGDVKIPSGSNLNQRLNMNLGLIGEAFILVPPVDLTSPDGAVITADGDVSDTELNVNWTAGAVPAGMTRVVEATPPLSPGVAFVKNQFRKIGQIAAAGTSPSNQWANYIAKFGAPAAGAKIVVRIKDVSKSTGIESGYYYATAIVTA